MDNTFDFWHNFLRLSSMNLISYILLFAVGIVAAATMVIPGISGSLVLMIIGYYYPIIDTIIIINPSTRGGVIIRKVASYKSHKVKAHINTILTSAPIISARWYP